jgi:hypothetical protein
MRTPIELRLLRSGLLGVLLLLGAGAHTLPTATAAPPAQQGSDVVLVNADEPFIERRSDGSFIARPILNVRPEILANTVSQVLQ